MTCWPGFQPAHTEHNTTASTELTFTGLFPGTTTITLGDTNTFGVNGICNRAQVVTFLYRIG